jgi:hypothetical protein
MLIVWNTGRSCNGLSLYAGGDAANELYVGVDNGCNDKEWRAQGTE